MKQKWKRTIVDNTNSDFRKRNKTRKKIQNKKEGNKKLPTKICPFSTPKIHGQYLITS